MEVISHVITVKCVIQLVVRHRLKRHYVDNTSSFRAMDYHNILFNVILKCDLRL